MSTPAAARWPLPDDVAVEVDAMAALIARDGPWHVLATPVVHTGTRDLLDPWTPTRGGLARMLARLAWHARVDRAVELDDARRAAPPNPTRVTLRTTVLDLATPVAGPAIVRVHEIGEAADAAAALAMAVGALVAGPARALAGAAVLGFGVLIVSAPPPEVDGEVAAALLAIIEEVRGVPSPALGSLGAEPAARVAAWARVVAGHGAELRDRLGLAGATAGDAPPRAVAPPAIVDDPADEARLRPFNAGREVHRVRHHHGTTGALVGTMLGMTTTLVLGPLGLLGAPAGAIVGYLGGTLFRGDVCDDPQCEWPLPVDVRVCPRCGGTVVGELAYVAR
jgi:hypothetical protein